MKLTFATLIPSFASMHYLQSTHVSDQILFFQWTSAPVQRKAEVQKIKEKCNKGAYLLTFFQLCMSQGKQKLKAASKPS